MSAAEAHHLKFSPPGDPGLTRGDEQHIIHTGGFHTGVLYTVSNFPRHARTLPCAVHVCYGA